MPVHFALFAISGANFYKFIKLHCFSYLNLAAVNIYFFPTKLSGAMVF